MKKEIIISGGLGQLNWMSARLVHELDWTSNSSMHTCGINRGVQIIFTIHLFLRKLARIVKFQIRLYANIIILMVKFN